MSRELKPCGTRAAYARHLRHSEEPCRAAVRDIMRARRRTAAAAPRPAPAPGVMYQDDSLPHQIRIFLVSGGPGLAVSCNCLREGHSFEPIEVRTRWEPAEAQAAYRAHLGPGHSIYGPKAAAS